MIPTKNPVVSGRGFKITPVGGGWGCGRTSCKLEHKHFTYALACGYKDKCGAVELLAMFPDGGTFTFGDCELAEEDAVLAVLYHLVTSMIMSYGDKRTAVTRAMVQLEIKALETLQKQIIGDPVGKTWMFLQGAVFMNQCVLQILQI